jgi:hypothetical protein
MVNNKAREGNRREVVSRVVNALCKTQARLPARLLSMTYGQATRFGQLHFFERRPGLSY